MLRAKDIEDVVRQRGFEKGLVYCVQSLAEQQRATDQQLRELALMFDKVVDLTGGMADALNHAKHAVEKLTQHEDDLGPNTYDAVRGKDYDEQ